MARKRSYRHVDTFRTIIHGDWCVYCGAIATTRDHFPPKSLTMRGLLLPCCGECNSLAGTDNGTDFGLRADLVKIKLRKRYRKILMVSVWGSEELSEMGKSLKREIRTWQERRRIIQSRLAWNAEGYLASIDKDSAFAELIAECGIITNCDQKPIDNSVQEQSPAIDPGE